MNSESFHIHIAVQTRNHCFLSCTSTPQYAFTAWCSVELYFYLYWLIQFLIAVRQKTKETCYKKWVKQLGKKGGSFTDVFTVLICCYGATARKGAM